MIKADLSVVFQVFVIRRIGDYVRIVLTTIKVTVKMLKVKWH